MLKSGNECSMRRYIVIKHERWLQRVEIEAEDPQDALRKAANGDSVINADPSYDDDIEHADWAVREEE